ncbi:hypothetical protein BKA62DRAFT_764236 [Auriculariales sp. MPI-PUGE-AT-0066]|nr:hypothetical protein BKA62DRAFT_764236 [Auriculariales sp. MPI-PUGE-AT-0066]
MSRSMAHSAYTSRSHLPDMEYDASIIHHYRDQDQDQHYEDDDPEYECAPSPEQSIPRSSRTPSPRDSRNYSPHGRPFSSGRHHSYTPVTSARAYTPTAAPSLIGSKYVESRSPSRVAMYKLGGTGFTSRGHSPAGRGRAEILSMIVAEEGKQLRSYKDANEVLSQRVGLETRRADDADRRAEHAERMMQEAVARAQEHSTARQQAEIEVTRLQEEVKRLRMQLTSAARELQRAQSEVDTLDRQRVDAEQGAVDAREKARRLQTELEAQRAREEGLLEGRMLGLEQSMLLKGANAARYLIEAAPPVASLQHRDSKAAYERGRDRGYTEGRSDGVKAEREHALHAFSRFIEDHADELPQH